MKCICIGISHPPQYVTSIFEVLIFADFLIPQEEKTCSLPPLWPSVWLFVDYTAKEQFDSNTPGVAVALLHILCTPPSPAGI